VAVITEINRLRWRNNRADCEATVMYSGVGLIWNSSYCGHKMENDISQNFKEFSKKFNNETELPVISFIPRKEGNIKI
jgi:hypothetical protein